MWRRVWPAADFAISGETLFSGSRSQPARIHLLDGRWGGKGDTVYGATDELGYRAVENRVSVAEFHATILHLLGLHHEELFFERNGLRDKLTFTHEPHVIHDLIA